MHSISTRATTHGRRRNLKRLGATAAGVFTLAAATAQIASAATTPTVTVQYPSYTTTVNGAPITVQVTVANPATTPANVTFLSVATACDQNGVTAGLNTPTAANAATGAGICPSGDGDPTFAAPTVSVDPNSPSCQSATFAAEPGQDTNLTWTVGNAPLTGTAGSNFCIFDVKLNAVSLPQSSFVYFAASAALTDAASQSAASAPVTSTIYVNPAAPTTTGTGSGTGTGTGTGSGTGSGTHNSPPPSNFTPPPPPPAPAGACDTDTVNSGNGNGNIVYGDVDGCSGSVHETNDTKNDSHNRTDIGAPAAASTTTTTTSTAGTGH